MIVPGFWWGLEESQSHGHQSQWAASCFAATLACPSDETTEQVTIRPECQGWSSGSCRIPEQGGAAGLGVWWWNSARGELVKAKQAVASATV